MILLNRIQLNNFLSHSNTEIDFKPDQNVLVDGKSGSGKSSIVEGLIWCLYGQGRSNNQSLIKKGNKKATVIVVLEDNEKNKLYKIERSITASNKHKLEITEAVVGSDNFVPVKTTGVKNTQEYLEKEILHSSYILFVNSIIYPQNNVENFVNQPAGKRKEIILEIINNAGYDDYLKRTKDELTKLKTDAKINNSRIEDKQNIVGDTKEKEEAVKGHQTNITLLLSQITEEEASVSKLETVKEETAKKLSQFDSKKLEKEKLEETTTGLREKSMQFESSLNEIKIDVVVFDENIWEKKKAELIELNKQKDLFLDWTKKRTELITTTPVDPGYDVRIELLNKQIINLMDQGVPACPKCGYQNNDLKDKHAKEVLSVTNDLKDAQRGQNDLEKALFDHKGKLDALGEEPIYDNDLIESVIAQISDLEAVQKQELLNQKSAQRKLELEKVLKEIHENILENNVKYKTLEKELAGIDKIQTEYEELQDRINKVKSQIASHMADKESVSMAMAVLQKELKDIEEAKEVLKKLKKDQKELDTNIESLELLKDALGPNGIKAIVIDYTIPQLEDKINDILSKLSDFRIRLDTQKAGLTKDTTLEGLFITIINDVGEELEYESFSGGEKVKISIAINEALAELSKINFRILDEAVVSLDSESTEQFLETMLMIQKKVSQIVCISHIDEIKNIFDHKLMVTKINGNSEVI